MQWKTPLPADTIPLSNDEEDVEHTKQVFLLHTLSENP